MYLQTDGGKATQRRRSWFVFGWEASVAAHRLFSSHGEWGSSLVSKPGLLLVVASLAVAHGL